MTRLARLPLLFVLAVAPWTPAPDAAPAQARNEDRGAAGEPASAAAEAERQNLPSVPEPSLSDVEDAVREQLRTARESLDELVADPETRRQKLAAGYGQMGQLYLLYDFGGAAEAAFRNARTLAPEQPRWPYYLGVIHQDRGELDAAAEAYRQVLDARPDDLATLIRLGRVELERNRPEAARTLFEHAAEIAPEEAAAFEGLGQAASRLGDHEAAVRGFERALELQPEASALRYPLALAYRQLGDLERAREHLASRGDQPTSFPDPLWDGLFLLGTGSSLAIERGNRLYQLGDLEGAATAYRDALEAEPNNAQALRALASVVAELGEREEAIELYRESLEIEPDHAAAQYNLGNLLVSAGRLDEAVERFERAVEIAPDFTNAHHNLARALEDLGRVEAAREAADRAVESLPDDPESRLFQARLELESRLREGAELPSLLEELRSRRASDGAALVALGVIASDRGADDLALQAHRAALASEGVKPAFAGRAHLTVGEHLLSTGESERALPHLRSASELAPDLATAHLALGQALGRRGDFDEAVRAFDRVLELEPDRTEAHFGRATALMLAGREEDARRRLEESLRRLPESVPLRHALARLLATAEEADVRDGETALESAREIFSESPSIDHAETVAMALAELGRFEDAVALQQQIIARARQLGREERIPALRERLERYRSRRPVRAPWS